MNTNAQVLNHARDISSDVKNNIANKTSAIGEKFGSAAYDVAEDARKNVVNAIEAASDSLQKFGNGAGADDNGYVMRLSERLKSFAETISSKDSVELAQDVKDAAKKYQTPLIIAGVALAFLALRPVFLRTR